MRYLALDWGTVRMGAAVSDPDGKIAFPLDRFIDGQHAIGEIKKIIQELEVEKILVGLPKGMAGQDTKTTEAVQKFLAELRSQVAPSVEVFDERLSSVAAGKQLSAQGVKVRDQRELKDNLAAQMMLQQHLDTKKLNQ